MDLATRTRRYVATAAALVALAGLIALFRFVQRYDASQSAAMAPLPQVSLRLIDAVLVSRHEGRPRWSVRAERIDVQPQGYGNLEAFRTAQISGIRDGTLYRDGRKDEAFSADAATYDEAAQRFDIRGHLKLRTAKGDRIEAPECLWSEREDSVRLPQGATASFRGNAFNAPYLLYAPRRNTVQCPQGASGTFDHYPLRAGSIDWDVDAGTVHCTGPITGERRGLTFDAREAWLDLKKHVLRANRVVARLRIDNEGSLPEVAH